MGVKRRGEERREAGKGTNTCTIWEGIDGGTGRGGLGNFLLEEGLASPLLKSRNVKI